MGVRVFEELLAIALAALFFVTLVLAAATVLARTAEQAGYRPPE